jgi:hypothetical protein
MSKPSASFPRPLADLLRKTLNEGFARQGFASSELVTRWHTIVGAEIATYCEPIKIQWPRPIHDQEPDPATLVLRVEGPMAIEIQHQSTIILEKVNRFFGWQAIGQIALRQAPLRRVEKPAPPAGPDPQKTARVAAELGDIVDEDLKGALARLGASVKRM